MAQMGDYFRNPSLICCRTPVRRVDTQLHEGAQKRDRTDLELGSSPSTQSRPVSRAPEAEGDRAGSRFSSSAEDCLPVTKEASTTLLRHGEGK